MDSPRPTEPSPGGSPSRFSGLTHSREFLETLRAVTSSTRASLEPVRQKSTPRRSLLLATAAVLLLLVLLAREQSWGTWPEHRSIPEVFHGAWGTTSERYADRGFVITSDSLELLFGGSRSISYPIVGVSTRPAVDSTLFTIHYRDEGVDLQLSLHLERDTTIHLTSLPMVTWKKR